MIYKVLFLLAFLVVLVYSNPWPTDFLPQEEACVRQGGICVRKGDCEPGNLVSINNLCPMNSHLGIECCYL